MNNYRRYIESSYHDESAIAQNRFANNLLAIGNAILTLALFIFIGAIIYSFL